jgi:hypothetical protein
MPTQRRTPRKDEDHQINGGVEGHAKYDAETWNQRPGKVTRGNQSGGSGSCRVPKSMVIAGCERADRKVEQALGTPNLSQATGSVLLSRYQALPVDLMVNAQADAKEYRDLCRFDIH